MCPDRQDRRPRAGPHRHRTVPAALGIALITAIVAAGCSSADETALEAGGVRIETSNSPPTSPGPVSGLLDGFRGAVTGVALPQDIIDELKVIDPGLTSLDGAAAGYDLATIATLSAELSRSDAPGRMAQEIRAVTTTGEKCTDFDSCIAAADRGSDPDYDGLTGAIELRADGRPNDFGVTEVVFDAADRLNDSRTLAAQASEPGDNGTFPDPLFGPRPDGVLRIGVVLPALGPDGATGRAALAAIRLVIGKVNSTGGALGEPVELIVDSEDPTPAAVLAAAKDDIELKHADVIIGGANAEISQALIEPVTSAGVLLLSGTDGARTPAGTNDRGLYIRLAPPDSIRSVITADELTVDGYLRICALAATTPANNQLLLELTAELNKRGAAVVSIVSYDPTATDYSTEATAVFQAGAEATVILGDVDDTARMIKALHETARGPRDAPTYGTDLNVRTALVDAIRQL